MGEMLKPGPTAQVSPFLEFRALKARNRFLLRCSVEVMPPLQGFN